MRISNGKQSYINLEEKEYNKLLDRLDKALIKNESLEDDLKAEQLGNLEKAKEIKELKNSLRLKNKTYKIYTQKIQGLRELVDDKRNEIIELKKDVEFYRSKVKVLLNDMLEYNINLGNKGGENA